MAGRKRTSISRRLARSEEEAVPVDGEDRRLYFAHRNGQRRETAEAVRGLVEAEFKRSCRGPAWRREVLGLLAERAGPELLARLAGLEMRRGELQLEVAEPAARYELRLRWEQRLLEMLRMHLPSAGITAVRFVASRQSQVKD